MCCFISAETMRNMLPHLLPKKSVMAWIPTKHRLQHSTTMLEVPPEATSEASEVFSLFCRSRAENLALKDLVLGVTKQHWKARNRC